MPNLRQRLLTFISDKSNIIQVSIDLRYYHLVAQHVEILDDCFQKCGLNAKVDRICREYEIQLLTLVAFIADSVKNKGRLFCDATRATLAKEWSVKMFII